MTFQARLLRQAQALRTLYQNTRRKWTSTAKAPNPVTSPGTNVTPTEAPMEAPTPAMAQYLGYAGTLPFTLGALGSSLTSAHEGIVKTTHVYGERILSFLGGVHWGVAMLSRGGASTLLRDNAVSVTPSLVGWICVLIGPAHGLPILAGSFSALFGYERFRFAPPSAPPAWFRHLRAPLSLAAVGSMSVTWLAVRRARETRRCEQDK